MDSDIKTLAANRLVIASMLLVLACLAAYDFAAHKVYAASCQQAPQSATLLNTQSV